MEQSFTENGYEAAEVRDSVIPEKRETDVVNPLFVLVFCLSSFRYQGEESQVVLLE